MSQNLFADRARLISEQQNAKPPPSPQQGRERAVQEAILSDLGKPEDLSRVEVKQLHDVNHYRVNIYRVVATNEKMTDSFYIVISPRGIIAYPPISKKYFDRELEELWAKLQNV